MPTDVACQFVVVSSLQWSDPKKLVNLMTLSAVLMGAAPHSPPVTDEILRMPVFQKNG